MANPNIHKLGPDAQKIEPLFVAALEGDRAVSWSAIETVTGKPRREVDGAVKTVTNRMFDQYGVDFMNLWGVGFRVRKDVEQADAANRDAGRANRIQLRRRKRMARVDLAKLPLEDQLRHQCALLRMEGIGKAASAGTAKKINNAFKTTHNMTLEERQKHIEFLRGTWKK